MLTEEQIREFLMKTIQAYPNVGINVSVYLMTEMQKVAVLVAKDMGILFTTEETNSELA